MPRTPELSSRVVNAHSPTQLEPLIDPIIEQFIYETPDRLLRLVEEHGSPLNIVWPHAMRENVEHMCSVLRAHNLGFEIFYGAKANKSHALIRTAIEAKIGVDVSSLYEFQDALAAGGCATRLCATGPAKTEAFHQALILRGALISVDSLEEFEHLHATALNLTSGLRAKVLLRYRPQDALTSRFGMGKKELSECLRRITQSPVIEFDGFHFHLSGYRCEDRAQAFREIVPFIDEARVLGLSPRMIDIGGGLPMQYVDKDIFESFLKNQHLPRHYHGNQIPNSFYPYGTQINPSLWLQQLLNTCVAPEQSVAQYLQAQDIILALEPGRSLVDQAAISLFRITRVKHLEDAKYVLFVEGSSFSACETWFNSEFMLDPILISTQSASSASPTQAYIAGHSCLDDDVLSRRFIPFHVTPQTGDLLVYVNTAGYQMDLLENQFHRHPHPTRITATCNADNHLTFSPDY
ncbi:Y4yA family PLP-dependent enzyme [Pseudomonas sp. M30-35]|uniref:Y4yA family PLP-dependent enzyme n=1 Tax=Pseudomonas sp. M30-35 TaxID=1981174 RepID=UPI000B3C1D9E|nr:Y4yA family PLP-dependent enzyme [Pseudomonas sp. M30-35]ARU88943.1 decarboxylase [Pseudomonas sp. M30-35]